MISVFERFAIFTSDLQLYQRNATQRNVCSVPSVCFVHGSQRVTVDCTAYRLTADRCCPYHNGMSRLSVLCDKLTAAQVVKKFPAFCVTRRFIALFIKHPVIARTKCTVYSLHTFR